MVWISVKEPLGAEYRGELGMKDLDRDLAVVLEIVRQVDRRHPARAELALDAVAVGESARRDEPRASGAMHHPVEE